MIYDPKVSLVTKPYVDGVLPSLDDSRISL